jgi:oligoribonuclease NrnB/cAMP/cGMP phosphodiesterase (DHH superfamily)
MKIFHHNDLDGRCAGAIVAQFSQHFDQEDFIEVDYKQPLPIDKVTENEMVYFVDYSFKESTVWQLDKVLEKTKNVVWCDHHTSSLELLKVRPDLKKVSGLVQNKISGAALIYMYLYKCSFEELPYYVKLVSDYDCWLYKYDPDTTHFKIGMDMLNHGALDLIWTILHREALLDCSDELTSTINIGALIKQYIDQDNKQYRKAWAYESEIEGYKCLVINRKSNSWIFGDQYDKYPLVMSWAFDGELYSYSIYSSNKDVDCSKIAEKLGGGGHAGAAGFTSKELLFKRR